MKKRRKTRSTVYSAPIVLEILENRVLLSGELPPGFDVLGYIDPGELNLNSIFGAKINAQGDLIVSGNCDVYSSDYGTFSVHGESPKSTNLFVAQIDLEKIKADWINFDGSLGELVIESDGGIRPSTYTMLTSDGYLDWSFDTDIYDTRNYDSGTTTGVQYYIKDSDCYDTIGQVPYGFGTKTEYFALEKIQVSEAPLFYEWQDPEGDVILYEDSSGTITFAIAFEPGNDDAFSYINNYTVWFNDTTGVKKITDGYRKVERYNATFSIDTSDGTPTEANVFEFYWKDFKPSYVEHLEMNSDSLITLFYYDQSIYNLDTNRMSQVGTKEVAGGDYYLADDGSIYLTRNLNYDIYLAKYDTSGSLAWSQTFGGSGRELGSIDLGDDAQGNVYVLSRTESADFPMVSPLYAEFSGYEQNFLARFDTSGSLTFSTYVPYLNVDHGSWSADMGPGYMAVAPDGDVFMGYTSSFIYKSRIVKMASTSAPSGTLADDYDEVGYVYTDVINDKGYLDLALSGAEKSTVSGDELVLSGDGAEGVHLKGKPALVDAANNIYRYTLEGDFSAGPVTVDIPAGTFGNDKGISNVASSATFNTIPDISPLQFSVALNEFSWDEQDEAFIYDGAVSIGLKPAAGVSFVPLVTISDGDLSFDKNSIYGDGDVSSSITGTSLDLFEGEFEIKLGQSATYYLKDNEVIASNDFVVAGLDFQLTSLAFASTNQLNVQGTINLPPEFNSFKLSVEGSQYVSLAPGGIGLTGGTLGMADAEIKLPYVEMKAESMSVEYVAATPASGTTAAKPDALRFRGKVTLPKVFEATADFTKDDFAGTDGYIEINANGEKQWFGKLSVKDIVIIPELWGVKEASLEVREVAGGGMMVQGDGIATVPPGMDIICGLGFLNDEFNYIKLGVSDLNTPIGATGAFLQSISGNVNNIADPDATKISFGGGLGFTAGPEISVDLPEWAGGEQKGSIAEFGLEGGFTMSELTGTGTVKVVGGLAEGTAVSTLNWEKETLDAKCSIKALSNLVTIVGTMKADKNMNVSITGQGAVTLPSIIPIWGGRQIAGANSMLTYLNDETYSNDYVAGWGQLSVSLFGKERKFTAGLKVNFDGNYSFLGGKKVARLQAGINTVQSRMPSGMTLQGADVFLPLDSTHRASETYYAQDDQGWMLINAQWENDVEGALYLTAPDGTVYDQGAIAQSDFIAIVPELSDANDVVLYIDQPDNGPWILTVESDQPLGNLAFDGYQDALLPVLTFDEISVNPYSQTASIAYSGDVDLAGYQIAFYYDTDDIDGEGILIGQQSGDGPYSWDTSTVAAGTYYIYATIMDDSNVPVTTYYADPVVIQETVPTTSVLIGNGGASKVSYTDDDGTVVSVSLKGDSGVLQFVGEGITTVGTKSVTVLGDNLFLQTVAMDGMGEASLSLSAKGGADNQATLGGIVGGEIKSLAGKGVFLAGRIDAAGAFSSMKWDDLGENVTISSGAAGKGFSLKAGDIGNHVTFMIEDTIKSFTANAYRSGEIDCLALSKLTVKEGHFDVDIYAVSGDVGSVSIGGNMEGDLYASGAIKSVTSKGGSLAGSIIATESVGKVSAPEIDGLVIYAQSVGSVASKGDILDMLLMATDGDVKSVKATGDISMGMSIEGAISSISTRGELAGIIRVKEIIKSISASDMTAMVSAGGDIGKVALKGDMVDSWIMAGYDIGSDMAFSSDDTCQGGNIGSVAVSGWFTSSYLLAGTLPEISLASDSPYSKPYFADHGDIGRVKFGEVSYEHDEPFGLFAATAIKPFKIGKVTAASQGDFNVYVRPS